MLCSSCGHNAVEVTAKFCSQCGHRLTTQPAKETADPDRGVKSTEASLEGENNYERKRPSEESTGNQKKKRKKKKKSKKKTEAPVSSEAQQVTSDLSHISLTHGQTKKRRAGRRSSDSDSFASATYDVQDSLHDGPSSLLHDGPSSLLHDGPSSLLHDGPSSLHDGPSSLHDGPSSLHDGPSSLESQSHSSAASTGASPSAVEPGESVTGESGVQRASVTSKTTRMGSPANVSAKTSSSEGNVSAKMSSSEGNMSAKTSSSEGNLSAKTDGSEGNVSARTSSSEGNISAKTSSSEGNISAKTSSSEGNLSAKTDSAKTSSSEGNISAKKSSSEGNISAKTSSSEGYVSAQTSSSEGNISAQTSSSEGNISAKTDSSESNVSAKTSSSESNENSKISSSEGNENSKISSSEGNENRKISSSESNKNAKISSSEGNENAKISSSEGNENSKISSSEGNENSKISSSEGNKNSAPQSESGDWTMVTNQRGQKTEAKSSKTKKNKLDQNANVTQNANQTEQDGPKQTGKTTGPQSKGEAEGRGSTVDPGVKLEHMEVQGSAHGAGDAAASTHPKEQEDSRNEDAQPEPPPKRITRANKPVAPNDRLTIYFHAVLSKDFKFDPEEDQIFLRAGDHIGTWDENTVELSVSKDLGEHGFLIEGNLTTTKTIALTVSIPYKYVVYKMKGKGKYEYEYIYKLDSSTTATTNRCLFVKQQLLNEEGDWHQYDDIICTEPSKNMLKRLREAVWPEQRKRVIQGREIAGVVMLETIFDLLRSWSEINLKSFLNQLNQFVHIYGNPTVYEETHHRWSSLNYGVDDVKALVKEFMVDKFIPQVLKDGGGKSHFLQDPLLAAVITLCVWKQQGIRLESSHLSPLCTALCLPRHDKEDLLKYWADFSHAVSSLKTLPEALVGLINTVKDQGMPRWILVLPLLHLLKGTTKPFQPTPLSVNSKTDALWAGLQGLKVGNPASLSSQEKRAMLNVMKTYSHLVEVDVLTGRSWMCLMPLEELVNCSVIMNTELLDMLHVFNLRAPQELSYASHKGVTDTLTHIQERLVEQKYRCLSEAYGRECLATAVKLLEKVCKGVGPKSYSQDHTDLPVACMHLVASVSDFACSHDDVGDRDGLLGEDVELLSQAMVVMREWIGRAFREALLSRGYTNVFITLKNASEAEIWNNVISLHFKNEDFTKKWRQTFMMDFEGKFKKEAALDQVEFYCSRIEDLAVSHPHVASTVEKCALEAVAHLCQTKSEGKLFERFKINGKFGTLISTIIQKSWPRDRQGNYKGEEEVVLQHILSWSAAKDIFQLHGAEGKLIEKLTLDARERIAVAISSFSAITKQLVYGTIKINLLNFILEKKQSFLELVKIDCLSEDQRYRDEAPMRRLLQLREQEVTAVLHEKELLDVMLAMSHKLEEHITVDVEDLEERHHINVESMTLDRFMEVHPFEQPSSPAAGVVTYFNLDEDIRSMAQVLHTFRGSFIFKLCWEEQARILATADADDDDGSGVVDYLATTEIIYEDIFRPCYAKYEEIYRSLKSDSIKLREVDKFFKDYKDKYEELAQDLDVMCRVDRSADKRWIPGRVQQIAQYHELHLAVASAQIIMTVKETLCLQGDFKVLQTLLEVTHTEFKMECLSRIDNDLMQAKAVLVDITEPRRLCLQELGRRRHFVNWVKEALEDINELKVFVDLASIYAGENDLDVDRVACFHDAVLGYSSLLYGLKPDSGFPAFQEALKKLWRALDNDSNLPKKLCDTSRHLEWLKTVKDSHGSVELSSLSLAAAVNSKGIYVIGAQDVKKLSLDTALKLQIPEEHEGGQEMRRYSLEDMRDLQNKLMLMSGKGDQGQNEVEHFVEVFSGVQRLAEAIIALYTAGNPLFRHLEVHINCSSSSQKPSILMDFNLTSVISVIILEGNVEVQLPELCRKMEKCLDYWMDFVDKQRSLHYYLNYYTAEQIVYLCSKLSRQNVDNLEDQVLMMLSFVKPNCESSDLRQVWHALQYKMLSTPQEINEDIDFQTFVEVPGCSQEGPDVTGELDSLPSLMEQASGSRKFDLMWNSYMKDMKNFLPHILDTRSLGRLLEILANREDERDDVISQAKGTCIKRDLPKGLAAGNPNLIVCPHDEVLTSCISIYMSSERELLPTYDEVLLCSPSTPYEQVELFLRRCLTTGYRGRKIYTLLYGDQLTYDVSSKVETFFQRMKLQSRNDYRLVMICSSDREHAYLPSAFSQYRLHMVPQEPLARIQKYLGRQYSVPADQGNAGAVFKDGLCVGVVASKRAGVGKSLYIKRLYKTLKHSTKKPSTVKCIRLIEPKVDESVVLQSLLTGPRKKELTIFHFDVTSSVKKGLDEFLFKLLVLHYLMDSEGRVWKCSNKHLYVIEILQSAMKSPGNTLRKTPTLKSSFMDVFPTIFCRSPKEVQMRIQEGATTVNPEEPLMDHQEFQSEAFQRPYQYLTRFHNHCDLDTFAYHGVEGSPVECLQMLLLYCGVMDPSWAELRNFAWFLNLQLRDCETSVFCDFTFTGDTLMGFKHFVVDFMIMMAKDFATPSLSISDQSPGRLSIDLTGVRDEDLAPFRIRKKWESEPHPYIFFNDDHVSMTFIGFHLRPNEQGLVDAIDPSSGAVIKRNAMTKQLYEGLQLQRVPFNINFDELPRADKIERLCNVLGIQWPLDPDETYELTTDNILKMLAIHMRFRCGIPVIIMGETGCGKTRLIKFLCELRRSGVATENMKLVKVHGGTTSEMVYTKIREAEAMALTNTQDYQFDSVLFFDEANTTEAISSIKEVLCDKTVAGEQLSPHCGLQIIAACNPYRKHTDEMIQRLESAGLGYRVRAEDTDEKLGSIPLRQLVYRVQSLPPSMIPLVWDFGQLNDHTEKMYIQQIVQRVVEVNKLGAEYNKLITDVLSTSQRYMRTRKDECSFVSLRDVERCMQTFVWFYKNHVMLFAELERFARNQKTRSERKRRDPEDRDPVLWSLIMSVGVCYHACLENKDQYRLKVCKNLPVMYSPLKVMQEILLMQDLLLSGVPLGDTIARNGALKENVFMMVLCIELRIPLFLVGKPGSSKSLSKTLVADAMQGQAAHSELYKRLKQIHLVSFQCSPHSTPEGIINTFKQCGRFQEGKNLKEYISVVVLDEIGLAEDSPKMPLKTLHPLLEEGCIDDEPLPHKKVGFIGISNWALDPAKMNRGIFVSRGDPDERELIESAKGICSSDPMILEEVRGFFQPFARAYLAICRKQGKGFFGLRDYYSLIKMIFAMAKVSQKKPSAEKIVEAVLRNFSGRDDVDAVSVFTKRLQITPNLESINAIELVRQNISAVGQEDECRYLLVLTKNYVALQILQQTFFSERGQPEIIFGSSFPKDQEYTQICRNINRVKICMETGQTVVLLNLQNLYESLYDALNQYYVCLGGQKYVDLGLGTHRVKCRVHKDFRLIVIEEKEVVYKQFPIPLINRLEKHYLDIHTVLKTEQKRIVEELERWVVLFVSLSSQHVAAPQTYACLPPDVFIGYHSDTCASVVLQVIERQREDMETLDPERRVLEEAKLILLNCATPDSVVRLDCTGLPRVESEHLAKVYFENQSNSSLADFILAHTHQDEQYRSSFTEVTTFSRLLTASDLGPLEQLLHSVELLSLQQFDTEQSFLKKIRHFLSTGCDNNNSSGNKVLIIQSDFDEASHSANLIASAKYSAINEINKTRQEDMGSKMFVFFITKLPRMEGGTSYVGFHGGPWRSVHIDDLRRSKDIVLDIKALRNLTIGQLFEEKANQPEAMDVDDMYSETEPNELQLEHQTGWDSVLDTTALVRSCVQSAVGTLRDQAERGFRSTRRVEILLALLSDNQAIQAAFLRTLKRRLHSLLVTHDGNNFSMKSNWVIKEASNIDALQEGGTFRHTLWKRVQAVVVPFLAQLVSVIDRDRNLDLLLDANSGDAIKTLWLDIFGNEKLLDVPYMTPGRNSETRTILVQSYIAPGNNTGCTLPFSWRIKDFLDELWVHALQHEGQTQSQFEEFYWKTPLGQYIAKADAETQTEFFQRYLQDFISMTMNVTREGDLRLLCSALNCCVNELRSSREAVGGEVTSLPWVHAAHHEFKSRLQNLSRMISMEPPVALLLLSNTHAREGMELVLDVYAAVACVEYLEPQALDTDAQRHAWLRQVKRLQVPIESVCAEDSVRRYGERSKDMVFRVHTGWNRIFSLSLFVEHMLLGIEEVDQKLKPLVLEHMRGLGHVLEKNSDLKAQQAFEAVIEILKACKDGAVKHIFRFGLQLCPVCMVDPHDPLSLPCGHIYCVACIKLWLTPGQMYCPLCMQPVPDDFPMEPSEHIRTLVNQHARFRKQCNAFFIDVVSTVCFKDNCPPCPAIILHLLSFLMVEADTVPIVGAGNRQMLTKTLSPFDDSVDRNPVVRSVVLKLLLKYSFDEVKGYLQQHLTAVEQSNILEETDKTELYCLYINCLEDSMFERLQFRSAAEQQACLQDESVFLGDYLLQSAATATPVVTVDYLQQVARVRLGLDMAAGLLVDTLSAAGAQENRQHATSAFLSSVVDLCARSGNDWYRIYLIRKICSQQGVEFVQKLVKETSVRWLFPEEVLQQIEAGSPIDQFLVCGQDYKTIRDAVAKAVMKGKVDGLEETCEGCRCLPQRRPVYLLLALFREVTSLYRLANAVFHPKPEQCKALLAYIQTSRVLASPEMKAFAQALVHNQLGQLAVGPGVSGAQAVVVELSIHLTTVLVCGREGILAPLQQLAMTPANMQRAFLPSMPEDIMAVARQAMGETLQWYRCPNGHPCTIGECGKPVEMSRCLDCGVEIGGINHVPVAGFQRSQLEDDRTQTGHILGNPRRRDNPDMLDTKDMSPVSFNLVRLLTHMALLLGATKDAQHISAIIKPPVPDPGLFLFGHLLKDMKHLTRSLGKGTDDTVNAVHLVISSLQEPCQGQQWPVPYDNLLSTKEARTGWEMAVSNNIITSQLKHLDRRLKEANAAIRSDSRVSSNPIITLMFGDPHLFLASLPAGSLIHGSAVWSCREKVSLLALTHVVEQNDGRDTLPVLWRFLQREAELRLVKFLPDILTLQRDLVKKFQNVTDLPCSTIAEFLHSQTAAARNAWYEKCINIFLTTWNQLRVSLATNGEIKIPGEFCQQDLDLSSDFQVLLPRRQGPGLCSTALVGHLISLHNDMVQRVATHTAEEEASYTVSPADLTELHVIRYEPERDLVPLVLSCSQYSMERGQEMLHEYHLHKIQRQVLTRFLQGKPLITLEGIPTLVNRHDRNYETILKDVKERVRQESLPALTLSALAGELQSYSEVCEALSTVEVALGFLAMTGGDAHTQLSSYLQEVLQMGDQTGPHILKALSVCSLQHCVALWQLLTSLKSENMLRLKRDPFSGVSDEYRGALGEEERRLVTGFFSKSSADAFLLELHEFLLLVLKNPRATDTYRPGWGLRDTLVSYMERKDLDVPPDVQEFPEQVTLSQCIDAWRFTVALKHERGQR